MSDSSKKAGYLRGLLEAAADLEADSTARKLFSGIVDLLDDLIERVDEVEDIVGDLNDYVESIDDDLTALEEESDGAFDFADEDYDEDDEEADEDDEDDDLEPSRDRLHLLHPNRAPIDLPMAVLCPECGKPFKVAMSDEEDARYRCPHCSQIVRPADIDSADLPLVPPEPEANR